MEMEKPRIAQIILKKKNKMKYLKIEEIRTFFLTFLLSEDISKSIDKYTKETDQSLEIDPNIGTALVTKLVLQNSREKTL